MINPRTLEDDSQQVVAEADAPMVKQTPKVERTDKPPPISLSESRIAFYLLVFAVVGFLLSSLVTDQEVIIALGTLNTAIIGAWVWAWMSKIRLLIQSLKYSQQSAPRRLSGG